MDARSSGDSYQACVGRWSRPVAERFLAWLNTSRRARWPDAGCGTGALTSEVLGRTGPASVLGLDPSPASVSHAAHHVPDPRASFVLGDVRALPVCDGWFDAAVCGLVLNVVPERTRAFGELRRACRSGGTVAACLGLRGRDAVDQPFWAAAVELDPGVRPDSEDVRFGFCRPQPLRAMFDAAGLVDVEVDEVVVPTAFRDFDELWAFLRGTGPVPAYVASLDEDRRADLAALLRGDRSAEDDGSIHLAARAWVAQGRVP